MSNCRIIIKDGERVGVYDDNNNPSKLFQEILSNPQVKDFSEALEIYKQTKSDKINFEKERVADKLPLTLAVFSNKSFIEMRGKEVNPTTVQQILNGGGIKQIEKDLINQVIEDNYKGQKKVSFDELEATVRANIMPLERITTSSYSDYGMDNLGNGDYGNAKTLIFNAPIEHGVTGHFSGDFKASGRQNIKYQAKQLNDNTWVAVEEDYESQANDNNIYQYVGTAGTKEAVDLWINNYNGKKEIFSKENPNITVKISKASDEDTARFADTEIVFAELIYDGKVIARNNVVKRSEEDIRATMIENYALQNDTEAKVNKGMFGHIRVWENKERNFNLRHESNKFDNEMYQKYGGDWQNKVNPEERAKALDFIKRKRNENQVFYVAELQSDYFQKNNAKKGLMGRIVITANEKAELAKDLKLKEINQIKDLGYRVEQINDDFILYKNNDIIVERKEEAKYQPKEDFLSEYLTFTSTDPEVLAIREKNDKEFEKILEKEIFKREQERLNNFSPQEKQFIASQKIWEQRMVREAIKEASLSGATSLRFPTPYTLSVIEGYVTNEDSEGAYSVIDPNRRGEDELTEGDMIEHLGDEYIIVSANTLEITAIYLDENIIRRYSDLDIEDRLRDSERLEEWQESNYYEGERILEEVFGNKVIEDKLNGGYVELAEGNPITFNQWRGGEGVKNDSSKDEFNISDLSDTQQTVARKYEEIAEILKKEKPVEVVTDENGFDWYETKITEKDNQNPVVAYSIKTVEPKLKYQTKDGRVFQSYSEALKSTSGDTISAGVNTVDGFKTLFEVESNTNVNTLGGMINNLIKSELLSDQSFLDADGNTYLVSEGNNDAKKHINADLIRSLMQKTLGSRSITITADGNVKVDKNIGKIQVDSDVFVYPQELKVDFKTLVKEFGMDKAVDILTAQVFNEQTSKDRKSEAKEEFVPENILQEKVMNLLKDMGIKTLSFEEYAKQYKLKNGIEPSASALADIANKLIAFRDGRIEQDDLLEETAHIIEASIPQADKENILRNIHKTKEWMEHSETYMRIYEGNEALVRKEILGKIIANGLKTRFEARGENQTEDSILSKLRDLVIEFLDRVLAYINPTIENQLEVLNKQIYNNLMNDTLASTLGATVGSDTMYSASQANYSTTSLYTTTKKILDKLYQQSKLLSQKYQSSSDRQYLAKTREALSVKEDEIQQMELITSISNIVRVTSSQVNILNKAIQTSKKDGYHFTSDESNTYTNLKNNVRPLLLELKRDLVNEVENVQDETIKKQLRLVQEELKKTLETLQELEAITPKNNRAALKIMVERVMDKADMTPKERELYNDIIFASLGDNQRDTDRLHAHIGSLLQAKNPILNLSGDNIERMHLEEKALFQGALKPLINGLDKIGMLSNSKLKSLFKKGYVINEIDREKAKKLDNSVKINILNSIIGIPTTEETLSKVLEDLNADTTAQGRENRAVYNKLWSKEVKSRWNTYFSEDFIKRLDAHSISINGVSYTKEKIESLGDAIELDDQYRRETTQIRINAGKNLTKEDQYKIQEINKRRLKDSNPRNQEGEFIEGLTEVYDDNLGRYVIVLSDSINSLPKVQRNRAETIFGLNTLSLLNQDFFKKENRDNPKGIPDSFKNAIEALQTEEERREFLLNNAYIGFPDSYWEQLSDNKSIVDRLREEGHDDLVSEIKKQQSIISNVLKQNRVFNRPSETNFNEMFRVHQLIVKDAQANLEDLYEKARGVLEDYEDDNVKLSESIVNEAYNTEVANQKLDTLDKQLDFIEEHVTRKGKASINNAKNTVYNINKGIGKVSKGMQKYFNEDMSESELNEALLNYAKSKLLPYFKKTEPLDFTKKMNSMPVLDFIFDESVAVSPNFSFYESTANINPDWLENNKAGKPQYTKKYIDSVKDTDYFNYFKPDITGKATQNLKEWEARDLILAYNDKMIEYNELTGSQDRYMMPQVRKTATERLGNTTIKGVKENLKDLITFRPEEAETGQTIDGDLAKSGSSLLTIPVQYNRELEDQSELTDNILYAYAAYGQAASLHKARKDNIGDILVLEDTLLGVDFKGKSADATNAYKMLQSQIQANYYGVHESFSYEAKILGKTVDLGKLAKVMNNFFKWTNITGVIVPLTSLAQSTIQKRVETMVGEVTNNSASKVANKFMLNHSSEAAKEVMGFTSNAFLNVVGEGLGAYNMTERFENAIYNKAARTTLKTLGGSSLHELGNFPVITRVFTAVVADYRFSDGRLITLNTFKKLNVGKSNADIIREWETKDLLLKDMIYATKDGVLDFTNPEFVKVVGAKMNLKGEELAKELQLKKEQMSQKALAAIQRVDSQIPMHQKSLLARDARFNFFLSHLNYLLVQIPLRFKERHYNISEETWQEGSYRTLGGLLNKMVTNPKDLKKVWKEAMADPTSKQNLKRIMVELGTTNALVVMAILLSNYVDDDKDEVAWATAFADYMLTRVATETVGSTTGFPSSMTSFISKPQLMAYNKLGDFKDALYMFDSEPIKSGSYAGKTRLERLLIKQMYFVREYDRISDPVKAQDTYNFFNNEQKDLFQNYAILSNFVSK